MSNAQAISKNANRIDRIEKTNETMNGGRKMNVKKQIIIFIAFMMLVMPIRHVQSEENGVYGGFDAAHIESFIKDDSDFLKRLGKAEEEEYIQCFCVMMMEDLASTGLSRNWFDGKCYFIKEYDSDKIILAAENAKKDKILQVGYDAARKQLSYRIEDVEIGEDEMFGSELDFYAAMLLISDARNNVIKLDKQGIQKYREEYQKTGTLVGKSQYRLKEGKEYYLSGDNDSRDIQFKLKDGKITITGMRWTDELRSRTRIKVPSEIEGYAVENIANLAFAGHSALRTIELPETIKSIGASAFADCPELIFVNIPEGVTRLSMSVFQNDEKLTEVCLPTSLEALYDLNTYTRKEGVITFRAQMNDKLAVQIHEKKHNAFVCFENEEATFYYQRSESGDATITGAVGAFGRIEIPSMIDGYTVTQIGENAFYDEDYLVEITIPDSVTAIGKDAFCECDTLETVHMSANVESIDRGAFSYCGKLKNVNLPDSLVWIGVGAFKNSNNVSLNLNDANCYPAAWAEKNEIPYQAVLPMQEEGILSRRNLVGVWGNETGFITADVLQLTWDGQFEYGEYDENADLQIRGKGTYAIENGRLIFIIRGEEYDVDTEIGVENGKINGYIEWENQRYYANVKYTMPMMEKYGEETAKPASVTENDKTMQEEQTHMGSASAEMDEEGNALDASETYIGEFTVDHYTGIAHDGAIDYIAGTYILKYNGDKKTVRIPAHNDVTERARDDETLRMMLPSVKECPIVVVKKDAFKDTQVRRLILPETLCLLADESLGSCDSLRELYVLNPETVIQPKAIRECSKELVVYGYSDSSAQKTAVKEGFTFVSLDQGVTITPDQNPLRQILGTWNAKNGMSCTFREDGLGYLKDTGDGNSTAVFLYELEGENLSIWRKNWREEMLFQDGTLKEKESGQTFVKGDLLEEMPELETDAPAELLGTWIVYYGWNSIAYTFEEGGIGYRVDESEEQEGEPFRFMYEIEGGKVILYEQDGEEELLYQNGVLEFIEGLGYDEFRKISQ